VNRPVVLGRGFPFRPGWSSNSTRKPLLFDWTEARTEATVDTVVHLDYAIGEGQDAGARKIAWQMESTKFIESIGVLGRVLDRFDEVMEEYDLLLTSDRRLCERHPRILWHPSGANLPWVPPEHYGIYAKTESCSMFASAKESTRGHRYRHEWVDRLAGRVDIYGGAAGTPRVGGDEIHSDKRAGLVPYRFSVTMENAQTDLYYTEKITDCFAVGTVPIYWGSAAIGEIFDLDGIILLDDEFDPDALTPELYLQMLPAVRRNHEITKRLWGSDDLLYTRYLAHDSGGYSLGSAESTMADVAGLLAGPARTGDRLLDRAVRPKTVVRDLADLTSAEVSMRPVLSAAHQPRTARVHPQELRWYDQQQRAFLLHVRDAFVGDNIVLDKDRWMSFGRWWSGIPEAHDRVAEIRHHDALMLISAFGGDAHQHFVIDAVPRLACVLDLLESPGFEHVQIATHVEGAPFASALFDRLGLGDRVVQKPRHPHEPFLLHADVAMYPGFDPDPDHLGIVPRHCLRPIQRRLGLLDGEPAPLALYLQRSGRRAVHNEDELLERVEPVIRRLGFELRVFRSTGDLEVDLAVVRNAGILFGPHGGAFANLIFAPPGAEVIEFLPLRRFWKSGIDPRAMYWGLAQAAGHHYWYSEPDQFDFEEGSMLVDIDDVIAVLEAIGKGTVAPCHT
jgi:hypothetical protein